MVVTFCGHGNFSYDNKTKEKLYSCIEKLIVSGATEFLMGGYGSFDFLVAHIVRDLKIKYPHITSTLVIPYINRSYDKHLYDGSVFPPLETVPKRYAILKRNRWMVDKSDVLIAYIHRCWGGAYTTYTYAQKKKKTIINIKEVL